jgi:SAM-dependent methyltransferase
MDLASDPRRSAPAALRNRDPILAVLRDVLPHTGLVLEIASGTGEHLIHFARHLPALEWQPSDPSPDALASIAAWSAAEDLPNIRPPLAIDASADRWPIESAAAMLCINMVHISPWSATEGLMRHAGRILPGDGPLLLYGPYRRHGKALEPSNAAFDADLRSRDPAWGLRTLDAMETVAAESGLRFETLVEMPANNLMLAFRKR